MFGELAFDDVVRCLAEAWSEVLPIAPDLVQGRRPAPFGHIEQPIDALKGLQVLEKRLGLAKPHRTPGGISIFYDVGQGQGWQRNIVMNGGHSSSGIGSSA